MSQVVDIEAQADLFGTYRVHVWYRSEDEAVKQVTLHGVSEWAVEQCLLALAQDGTEKSRRNLRNLLQEP